jgi:peptide/nickel transport system substrate-binding protein
VARAALAAAVAVALLAAIGAGGPRAQTPKRGGTLAFALPQPEPACLNPLLEQCSTGTTAIPLEAITHRVLEAPFEVGSDFTWRPKLVSRASFTTRRPFVLTYRIRRDARWSDGVPVTARDFVFTHRAIVRHGSGGLKDDHADLRAVRVVDAKTVRVVLRSRLAGWRGLFGPILPSHALRGANLEEVWRDRIHNPKTGRPIGTGPFLVERWQRGRRLTLVRNPRHWSRRPAHLRRLVVRFDVDATKLVEGFRRRELDMVSGFPPTLLGPLRGEAGLVVASRPTTGWEHLDFRIGPGGNPLLKNKLVRRAIAYGVNRARIVRELNRESGLAFRQLHSTVFLTQSRYYTPNWKRYRYRPAYARQLLEQTGCRRGSDGIYMCEGVRLALRGFTHVSAGSVRPRVLELVQAQLRQAGVEVLPTFSTQAAVFGPGGIYERGAFDLALFAWLDGNPDPFVSDLFGCGGRLNVGGYCQRLVTVDLDQAERIFAADRGARVLNRADTRMAIDVPILPLFQHATWSASRREVRGEAVHPHDALLGAENWWLAR